MRSRGFAAVLVLMIAFTFAGCGKGCALETNDSNEVRFAMRSNPKSLDPAFAVGVNGGIVGAKLFNGLVRFEENKVVPDLAESWDLSEDGLTYTFKLRTGVKFHNGKFLKAVDIKKSFDRVIDPATASPRNWVLAAVSSIEATDSQTLTIKLKEASASFLSLLTMPAGYVMYIPEGATTNDFSEKVIGSGPFSLTEWSNDDRIILSRNNNYFGVKANVDEIIYRILPEDLTSISLLKQGEIDVTEIPSDQFTDFQENAEWKNQTQTIEELAIAYVAINFDRFKDPRIRQAFNLTIDRETILEAVKYGLGEPAGSPVPPSLSPGKVAPYEFNPEKAMKLLSEAGFDFSKKISILRSSKRTTVETTEAIAAYLGDVGIKVEIEPMEFSSLLARLERKDFDLCLLNWYADYADPENFLMPLFHSKNVGSSGNRTLFVNSDVDLAIESVVKTNPGPERDAAIMNVQQLIHDQAPWIFLWYPQATVAVAPRLSGYTYPVIFNADKGTNYKIN